MADLIFWVHLGTFDILVHWYCKLVILDTWSMPKQTHLKIGVSIQSFLGALSASKKSRQFNALLLRDRRFVILSTLGMFRHASPHPPKIKVERAFKKPFCMHKLKAIHCYLFCNNGQHSEI